MTAVDDPIRGPDVASVALEVLALIEGATLEHLLADVAAQLGDPGLPRDELAAALHRLDDAGRVWMRNGFYRLSAAERLRRGGRARHAG